MAENRPIHSINYGTIAVSLWQQPGSGFVDISVKKRFRKDPDTWASAHNFGEYDLPMLAKAILDAHSWIQAHKASMACNLNLPAVVECENAKNTE